MTGNRDKSDKLTVRKVLLRRYPSLAEFEDQSEVQDLLDPVGSAVGEKVEKWYARGFRAAESSRIRDGFVSNKIEDKQIAKEVGCSLAALNRMWNGVTDFRQKEILKTRYPQVFNNFKPPSGNEMFVEGSCLAIRNLFDHSEKLFNDLDISIHVADPLPAMEAVNFSFLFFLVRDELWNQGNAKKDSNQLLKGARSIHNAVRDSELGDHGRLQLTSLKLPEELDAIYRTWFPWFFIVVETIVRPGYPLNGGFLLKDIP